MCQPVILFVRYRSRIRIYLVRRRLSPVSKGTQTPLPSGHHHSNSITSNPNMDTAVQLIDNSVSPASITPDEEGSPDLRGDIQNPTITRQRRNGDPIDWKSWPTGRPGPLVSEAAMQQATNEFNFFDSKRHKRSRKKEKVFHVTEFSSTGRSEFSVVIIWPE